MSPNEAVRSPPSPSAGVSVPTTAVSPPGAGIGAPSSPASTKV